MQKNSSVVILLISNSLFYLLAVSQVSKMFYLGIPKLEASVLLEYLWMEQLRALLFYIRP